MLTHEQFLEYPEFVEAEKAYKFWGNMVNDYYATGIIPEGQTSESLFAEYKNVRDYYWEVVSIIKESV